jgi:alpha-glucosidase
MVGFPLLRVSFLALATCATGVEAGAAQTRPAVSRQGDALSIAIGEDRLELLVCAPNVLRVDFEPGGQTSPETAVLAPRSWAGVGARMELDSDPMVISTEAMTVKLGRADASISVYDAKGKLLLGGQDPGGARAGGFGFSHQTGQNFYGISGFEAKASSAQGLLRQGGGAVRAGKQGYCGGPLAWSTAGYGLLVDSDGGRFAIDETSISFSGCSKKDVEYFAIVGEPESLMSAVADISGHAPMLPKWAMGFMNSQWGSDQSEIEGIVDTYRAKRLPIDCMILDFDWKDWGGEDYGEWSWNSSKFPDGPSGKLKAEMDAKGIKLVGIMKPRILVGGEQGAYASSHGFWYPSRAPYRDYFSGKMVDDLDFSKPECRAWFWERFEGAFDTGMVGWWNDEADGFDDFEFMNMERSLYEGQRAYSGQRVFSLDRNFYLGSQRYAYALWSGDIDSGFYSMASQRERMLSAAALGEAQWGMDSGGFNGTPSPENYARWIEFSAFTPIFRVHGTKGEKRQPWRYGAAAEAAAAKAMRLRYSLIPYIYSYERRASEAGVGLVEPLCFKWPSDPKVANDSEAWMFGDYLLVSPVVEQGQAAKSVYLPSGSWIDYWSGRPYEGGRAVACPLDADSYADMPLFVREGAIIPSQDEEDYVGEKAQSTIYLDVFPSAAETSFAYYDDDGSTYGYEKGEYFGQLMRTVRTAESVRLEISSPEGSYSPEVRTYLCRVHGFAATAALLDGRELTEAASPGELLAEAGPCWCPGEDRYGAVAYATLPAGSRAELTLR